MSSKTNVKRLKSKRKQTKLILLFDEKSRADYLQGFRKRKLERKKHAKEKLAEKLKEEKKELKKQARELMKARSVHQPVVPEVDHLVNSTEYDLPEHTVTITNIAEVDFSGEGGVRLGQNRIEDDNTDVRNIMEEPETEEFKKMKSKYNQMMEHVNKLENQSRKKKISMKTKANRKKRRDKLRKKKKK